MEPEGPPLVPIISWIYSLHAFPPYFPKIYSNINIPSMPRSSEWSFRFRFSDQNYVYISHHPILAIWPTHLILLHFIALIIHGEAYNFWRSSLCSLLQPPATSSFLDLNILLGTLFLNNLDLCSSLSVRNHISQPYKTAGKIIVYIRTDCVNCKSCPLVFEQKQFREQLLYPVSVSWPEKVHGPTPTSAHGYKTMKRMIIHIP
jgi:hypothetical protein